VANSRFLLYSNPGCPFNEDARVFKWNYHKDAKQSGKGV
jgi:hypothetical protein